MIQMQLALQVNVEFFPAFSPFKSSSAKLSFLLPSNKVSTFSSDQTTETGDGKKERKCASEYFIQS
jgi:hypothetical protein